MKKTLFILLALGSVAAAADVQTTTHTGGTSTYTAGTTIGSLTLTSDMTTGTTTGTTTGSVNITGGNFYAGDYTLSLWVDENSFSTTGKTALFAYSAGAPNQAYGANAIVWDAPNSTLMIGRGQYNADTAVMTWAGTDYKSSSLTLLDGLNNITISVTGANQSQTATLWLNGVEISTLTSYKGNMNGAGNAGANAQMVYHYNSSVTYGTTALTNEKYTDAFSVAYLAGAHLPSPNHYQTDESGTPTLVFEVNGEETVYIGIARYEVGTELDSDATKDGFIMHTVNVGDADYAAVHEEANNAESYVVNKGGTLTFIGHTLDDDAESTTTKTASGMTVEELLTTTTGDGDIILRTRDKRADDVTTELALVVDLAGKTQVTGNLHLSPVISDGSNPIEQSHVEMNLHDGADISSFNSVVIGSSETEIIVDGKLNDLGEGAERGHIHNLTMNGCSAAYLMVNTDANPTIRLSGDTLITERQYTGNDSPMTSALNVQFYKNSSLQVDHLTGDSEYSYLYIWTGDMSYSNENATDATPVDSSFNIDSFDYDGRLHLYAYTDGSIDGRINLIRDDDNNIHQKLYDYQVSGTKFGDVISDVTIELDGAGTYVLSEGNDILPSGFWGYYQTNFATLAETWTGTVEVNRLVSGIDFTDYGNADSSVHFKGFKGAVGVRAEGESGITPADIVEIAPNIILENVPNEGEEKAAMYGFEIVGAPKECTSQKLVFEGDISGDGDFVINTTVEDNTTVEEDITFTGDLSGWVEADETSGETPVLLAAAGSHKVTFSGNVAELNADVLTANTAELNVNFARSGETEVNGIISHEAGGKMDLSVAEGTAVTFNDAVDVDTAAINGTAKVDAANTLTAGSVTISGRTDASLATLSSGVQVSANSVSGGMVAQSLVDLKSGSSLSVSDVVMSDTTVTADDGQKVKLSGVSADTVFYNNVVLSGKNVSYVVQPAVTDKFIAAEDNIRKISMSASALSGMTLAEDSNAQITLADASVSGWTADNMPKVGDTLDVTIVLSGFVMDYVVRNGTVNGALATLETATWLDGLSLNNTILNRLDLTDATIKYSQNFYETDTGDPQVNNFYNSLTITITGATLAIPEPTTATLSLLALVGLAARRRRH